MHQPAGAGHESRGDGGKRLPHHQLGEAAGGLPDAPNTQALPNQGQVQLGYDGTTGQRDISYLLLPSHCKYQ